MDSSSTWLITGGAGYIGSHIADNFLSMGRNIVIYDSLRTGLESRIDYLRKKHKSDITLIVADIRNAEALTKTIKSFSFKGVIHTAALKSVNDSVKNADEYFDVNFYATRELLKIVGSANIRHFVFSSTAAVYGSPQNHLPVNENDPKNPITPYGASKLAAEIELIKFLSIPGNFGTALRFFNVVGASALKLQDNSTENLVPLVVNNLKAGKPPLIYGCDYPTLDGTCVRDFVDVRDVATAHALASSSNSSLPYAINVGNGAGRSVREVVEILSNVLQVSQLDPICTNRRIGDSAVVVADNSLMSSTLQFTPEFTMEESIESLNLRSST
jgi:UDP-glucose 4-epimerase